MAAEKTKVLVIGATGRLGQHLVTASLAAGHPTFALVRELAFSNPRKSFLLRSFSDAGVTLIKGSLNDLQSLHEAIKLVDVVICSIPGIQSLDQQLLIQAIKEAGCIKRFIPSEFGCDVDKSQILGMDNGFYGKKAEVRRLIEKEGIPHTYICCNLFMGYLLPSLVQPGLRKPPRDTMTIFGDGNVKAVFVKELDVATFTINTIDDPKTLNKVLYLRPPGNVVSFNELAEMWEAKIQKKLEKIYIQEEQVLRFIQETPFPGKRELIFIYSAFIKGDHTYFSIEESSGLEGTQLYPDVKYTTVTEFLDSRLSEF
ncbi:putative 2'-hydroxyisoflavone reductase [Dioscorea sansibarensis]